MNDPQMSWKPTQNAIFLPLSYFVCLFCLNGYLSRERKVGILSLGILPQLWGCIDDNVPKTQKNDSKCFALKKIAALEKLSILKGSHTKNINVEKNKASLYQEVYGICCY